MILSGHINSLHNSLTVFPVLSKLRKTQKNIMGKGENAGNQHFLLFPKCLATTKHIPLELTAKSLPRKTLVFSKAVLVEEAYFHQSLKWSTQ